MPTPRRKDPDPRVVAAAQALSAPLRRQIEDGGLELAESLEVPPEVATAALASVLSNSVVPGLIKEIGRDALAQTELGKTAAYEAVADLTGASRQGVMKLYAPQNRRRPADTPKGGPAMDPPRRSSS